MDEEQEYKLSTQDEHLYEENDSAYDGSDIKHLLRLSARDGVEQARRLLLQENLDNT
jgi:hypothetical protein